MSWLLDARAYKEAAREVGAAAWRVAAQSGPLPPTRYPLYRLLDDEATELGATAWRVAAQSGLLACCVFVAAGGWRVQRQELVQQLGVLQHRVAYLHVVRGCAFVAGGRNNRAWCNSLACCSTEWPACMLCVCCWRRLEDAAPRVGATAWRVAAQSGLLACCAFVAGGCSAKS